MSETKQIETIKVEENNKVKKIKIDSGKLFIASMVALSLATVISSTIVITRLVEVKWMMLMMHLIIMILTPIIYKIVDFIEFQ